MQQNEFATQAIPTDGASESVAVATSAPVAATSGMVAPAPASSLAVAPSAELQETLSYDALTEDRKKQVMQLVNQTDLSKSDVVLTFGNKAQSNVSTFSASALQSVRAVDLGPMGDKVAELVTDIRGFNGVAQKKTGLFYSMRRHLAKVKAEYTSVEKNVNTICKSGRNVKLRI